MMPETKCQDACPLVNRVEALEEANKQGLIAFEFAKEIIEKVDGILEV